MPSTNVSAALERPAAEQTSSPAETWEPCPVQESIRLIGRKWHLIVLWELSKRPHGFNALKHATRGISAKMLSQSLNELEAAGLVQREILSERPLRVSYRLTRKAEDLEGMFAVLHSWGQRHGLVEPTRMADR